MRIIYLGNQNLGVRCLRALVRKGEDVVAVVALSENYWTKVSKVDQENIWYESVANTAKEFGLPIYTPEDINDEEFVSMVESLSPDVIFSISWDQMLKNRLLGIPRLGCFNLHDSLLPENRGHAPINWAIINGYTKTGMTMHSMVEKADRGEIVGQREIDIGFSDSSWDVYLKALDVGEGLFNEVLCRLKAGTLTKRTQKHALGTYGARRRPPDGIIDWNRSAFDLYNWIRALTHPYPGAFTEFMGRRLFIWESLLYENCRILGRPGQMVEGVRTDGLRIATNPGSLLVTRMQLEGEEEMDAQDFAYRHNFHAGGSFHGPEAIG